mgnify:CR=1 FL=1
MKKNALLTVFKTTLSLFVPLIAFPYISRVLQVDAIGKYNFSSSIISYFVLLAGLGVSTYAIREGAKIRESRNQVSQFVSEVFFINCISTTLSYVLLILCLVIIPKLHDYTWVIIILSVQIIFTTYGRSWVYNIFEDFGYVTLVQVGFQILSIVLLFLLVHRPEDIYFYAIINVLSSTGANLLYGIHAKKYVDFKKIKLINLRRHIRPILIIFSTSIATTIYVNSDMTILGWMVNDRCVGLYSTAVKIYNIIKQLMVAVITVTVPRLTLYAGTEKFKPLFTRVFNMLLFMALPAMTGLLLMSDNAVILIAGENYVEAATALQWLSVALICALMACLFGTSVLLPYNKEEIFLKSTVVSAIINIVLNFILIPAFLQNAAAFTTALSQGVALIMCYHHSREYISLRESVRPIICTFIGCIGMVLTYIIIKTMNFGLLQETIMTIIISVVVYMLIQCLTKNITFYEMLKSMREFIWRKFK